MDAPPRKRAPVSASLPQAVIKITGPIFRPMTNTLFARKACAASQNTIKPSSSLSIPTRLSALSNHFCRFMFAAGAAGTSSDTDELSSGSASSAGRIALPRVRVPRAKGRAPYVEARSLSVGRAAARRWCKVAPPIFAWPRVLPCVTTGTGPSHGKGKLLPLTHG